MGRRSICYYAIRSVYIPAVMGPSVHGPPTDDENGLRRTDSMRPSATNQGEYPSSNVDHLPCCQVSRHLLRASGWILCFGIFRSIYSVRRPFPSQLELLQVYPRCSPTTFQSTHPFRSLMDPVSTIVVLAIVFKSAKDLRDRIKLVRYPPHPLRTFRALIIILHLFAGCIGESGTPGSTHRI